MSTQGQPISHTISPTPHLPPITIREATAADAPALIRLAQRDSSAVPRGSLLVAEIGGELRAAIGISAGDAIADPFHPTSELVALLRARLAQARRGRPRPPRYAVRTPARGLSPAAGG